VDESGFYLLPGVVATWAPRGQTPVLEERLSRQHLSVSGALTEGGRWFTVVQETAFNGLGAVGVPRYLLHAIPGKLLVLWDGAPIHRSILVKRFLAAGAARRLRLEPLPGYAPQLNPVEKMWKHLKQVELKNLCCDDTTELRHALHAANCRTRHKKHVMRGSLKAAGAV
jgi:transposase